MYLFAARALGSEATTFAVNIDGFSEAVFGSACYKYVHHITAVTAPLRSLCYDYDSLIAGCNEE